MESVSRRHFLAAAGASAAALAGLTPARAEPQTEQAQWLANHQDTRLVGADGAPIGWLPRWSHLRLMRGLPNGWVEVWVPRLDLVGRVPISTIGPVAMPSRDDLDAERADGNGVRMISAIGLPGRVVRGGNLRLWPATRPTGPAAGAGDTLLRALGHNAPLRVIASVEGEQGEEWYQVALLDGVSDAPQAWGYIHNSTIRLPRLQPTFNAPDRADDVGKWFEADLREPAMLVAFEHGAPVWSTLTLKGTAANRTPTGTHRILYQVANETMNSETLHPPIPRDAPGGYFLKNVLYTQYFTWDGASIHYNYWSSNWGYPGSHGCLGVALNEAKFAWNFGDVGTQVRIFA